MGYYMRYIVDDDRSVSVDVLNDALRSLDKTYSIRDGDLYYGSDLYAEIEVNSRGEDLCDEVR